MKTRRDRQHPPLRVNSCLGGDGPNRALVNGILYASRAFVRAGDDGRFPFRVHLENVRAYLGAETATHAKILIDFRHDSSFHLDKIRRRIPYPALLANRGQGELYLPAGLGIVEHLVGGGRMTKRRFSTRALLGVLLVGACSLTAVGEGMNLEAALAVLPEGEDVQIAYSAEGRAILEEAIDVLERELGVTAVFDHADEADYMALEIPLEHKTWVNALSQAYYTLGDVFVEESAEAKQIFTRGQFWGLKSLRMSADFATEEIRQGFIAAVAQETDPGALLWTYDNWARKDEYDPLGAIARNDPPKLVAMAERLLEIAPDYISYSAYRALAAFWGGLPPLPLITFGQNLPRALSYICPVINEPEYCADCGECPVAPNADQYFENRLIFAQYYLMEKELWDEAARVLQSILDEPTDEPHLLYNAYCRDLAGQFLEQVNEKR